MLGIRESAVKHHGNCRCKYSKGISYKESVPLHTTHTGDFGLSEFRYWFSDNIEDDIKLTTSIIGNPSNIWLALSIIFWTLFSRPTLSISLS